MSHTNCRVALVTGAGRGIGRAIALRLAQGGADIAALDVDEQALRETVSAVMSLDRRAMSLAVDLYDVAAIDPAVNRIVSAWERLDILVNNAGIVRVTPFLEVSPPEWDSILSLDLRAVFFCIQAAARVMIEQKAGRIVNIASVRGLAGSVDMPHYSAAKAGVISLTYSAALALAPHGITVNAVCPGVVDTAMTQEIHSVRARRKGVSLSESLKAMIDDIPLGRMATPDDVAAAVAALVAEDLGYVTGQVISVDGGQLL